MRNHRQKKVLDAMWCHLRATAGGMDRAYDLEGTCVRGVDMSPRTVTGLLTVIEVLMDTWDAESGWVESRPIDTIIERRLHDALDVLEAEERYSGMRMGMRRWVPSDEAILGRMI